MSSSDIEGAHKSLVSQDREANLFLWWPSCHPPSPLVGCLNLNIVGPITSETFLRWNKMISRTTQLALTAYIATIEVRREGNGPFCYAVESPTVVPGPELLTAGNYGCYACAKDFDPGEIEDIFAELQKRPSHNPFTNCPVGVTLRMMRTTDHGLDEISEDLRGEAIKSYQTHCLFTRSQRAEVNWIFPPAIVRFISPGVFFIKRHEELLDDKFKLGPDEEKYRRAENLFPIRADLYELWKDNAFSVDVDDNFRICTFTQAAVDAGLPTHIPELTSPITKDCLKEHFRWSLQAHFLGGDMREEVKNSDSDEASTGFQLETLEAELVNTIRNDGDVSALGEIERWKTVVGREILTAYAKDWGYRWQIGVE